jgi:hypothetical protein
MVDLVVVAVNQEGDKDSDHKESFFKDLSHYNQHQQY